MKKNKFISNVALIISIILFSLKIYLSFVLEKNIQNYSLLLLILFLSIFAFSFTKKGSLIKNDFFKSIKEIKKLSYPKISDVLKIGTISVLIVIFGTIIITLINTFLRNIMY